VGGGAGLRKNVTEKNGDRLNLNYRRAEKAAVIFFWFVFSAFFLFLRFLFPFLISKTRCQPHDLETREGMGRRDAGIQLALGRGSELAEKWGHRPCIVTSWVASPARHFTHGFRPISKF